MAIIGGFKRMEKFQKIFLIESEHNNNNKDNKLSERCFVEEQ